MLFRKATNADIPEIKTLWKIVFLDSDEFVSCFFAHFGYNGCFVCEINSEIVAMAFALPTTLSYGSKFKVQSSNPTSQFFHPLNPPPAGEILNSQFSILNSQLSLRLRHTPKISQARYHGKVVENYL